MKRFIPVCLLLITFIAGCKKSNNQPTLNFSDLPFKQGNSWTYSRYDESVNVRDTVIVTISSVSIRNDTSTYLWVQNTSNGNDTAIQILYKDTLWDKHNNAPFPILEEIIFPLTAGSTSYYTSDSCAILNKLQINNIVYNNIYQVNFISPIYTDFPLIRNIYFVKGIGIVRYNQNTYYATTIMYGNLGMTNYQWDLLSYHLN